MGLFSKITKGTLDWATGSSISYAKEDKAYSEFMNQLNNLEEKLDDIIEKGTYADEWAIFKYDSTTYTIPMLKAIISDTMKEYALSSSKNKEKLFEYASKLQEVCNVFERKIKIRITEQVMDYEEFNEIYWILIELKKIIKTNITLPAFQEKNNNSNLPKYEELEKIKELIHGRNCKIKPYLGEMEQLKRK